MCGYLYVAAYKRDAQWAYLCCKRSRQVHEDVWELQIKPSQVLTEILPLLENVRQEMDVFIESRTGKLRQLLKVFSRNIDRRIDNLRNNYVEGKPSAFCVVLILK